MKEHPRAASLLLAAIGMVLLSPMAVRADGPYLAMAGQNQKIELLRLTDFTPVASIDVSPMEGAWLTFLPLRRRLYALDASNTGGLNAVLDFGTCSSGLFRPITAPTPYQIVANGDESRLLLSSAPLRAGIPDVQNAVYVLDPSNDSIIGTLGSPAPSGSYPFGMAFDPDRNELHVTWTSSLDSDHVYDGTTLAELRRCSTGVANLVAVNGKVYLNGVSEGVVGVVDSVTCSSATSIYLGAGIEGMVRTRAGDKVYVLTTMSWTDHGNPAHLSDNAVTVIDTLTDQTTRIPLNRELYWNSSILLSSDETSLYIAMDGFLNTPVDNAIGVLSLQTGHLDQYPLDTRPIGYFGLALIDKLGFQCGDGVVESACGEQCDPPGTVVNGTLCDVNCTMGCGNGIVSGTEQCDDGNTNNNDGCKNDCTANVCGDGFVYRGVEQCDHGILNGTDGDACDANCHLPPRTASADVGVGSTITTDAEADGATVGAPVETWLTSPVAGHVSIEEGAPDPTSPTGYAFLGYSVHVTVPNSTADNPIVLVFEVHSSLLPPGANQAGVEFSKNGALVPDCSGAGASPDPCVAGREILGTGNLRVTIRSSTASYWGGVAPLHDARVLPRRQISLTIPATKLAVTKKALVRVRNMDRAVAGQRRTTPIQLTATNMDCPLGLIADVPDFNVRQPLAQDTVALAPKRSATARLRLLASRFAFPKENSPRHCTIKLTAAAQVADNVDPMPADNSTTVQINVTTR